MTITIENFYNGMQSVKVRRGVSYIGQNGFYYFDITFNTTLIFRTENG